MARKHGGIGLGGLLVVLGLLYFTGAGGWLWERVKHFDNQCHEALIEIGTSIGGAFCDGFGKAVEAIDRQVTGAGEGLGGLRARLSGMLGAGDFENFTERLTRSLTQGNSPLSGWTSSSDRLRQIMSHGPQIVSVGASPRQRIRAALDNFVIGQHYLQSGQDFGATHAIPWLREGARQPGYGILSQLALGDIYKNGAPDVPANPQLSLNYYQQAHYSLHALNRSNTPEAQRMLQSLPASPEKIQKQLYAVMADIRKQVQKK